MNNEETIRAIEQIVRPYFYFEMDDFYGDRGGLPYPEINALTHLYFKKNGRNKNLTLTKAEELRILDTVKTLDIGVVEIIQIPSFGRYIKVDLHEHHPDLSVEEHKNLQRFFDLFVLLLDELFIVIIVASIIQYNYFV
jgi:hypothetical protein